MSKTIRYTLVSLRELAISFGPFLLLVGAIFLMLRLVRASQGRRPTAANYSAPMLSAAQRAKAQALLNDVNPDRPS